MPLVFNNNNNNNNNTVSQPAPKQTKVLSDGEEFSNTKFDSFLYRT